MKWLQLGNAPSKMKVNIKMSIKALWGLSFNVLIN